MALTVALLQPVLGLCLVHLAARSQDFRTLDPAKRLHTRWVVAHALANAAIAFLATPSLVRTWTLATGALVPTGGATASVVVFGVGLHVYHALCYDLSSDDRVHHVLYALLLGVPCCLYATEVVHAMLFFLSGLPGGILYAVIALRRWGCVTWNEPRLSAWINCGLRAPGVLVCLVQYARLLAREGSHGVPWLVVAMQMVLPVVNAVYYTHQSLVRYRR